MRLRINHRTEYLYDVPVRHTLQRLRLVPVDDKTQTVHTWMLSVGGAKEEVRFTDHFGNETRLFSIAEATEKIIIEASGEVETFDGAGILGENKGFAPLWLYLQQTPLTEPGSHIRDLAASIDCEADLDRLHQLMNLIRGRVAYTVGATHSGTSAEDALKENVGVCQDHAHIFVSAARLLDFPSRYASGYLMLDGSVEQTAGHAWAEAYVSGLGWVAFDPSNGISPDERYVRVAVGRDYREAMPVWGIRIGQSEERLAVSVTVEQ